MGSLLLPLSQMTRQPRRLFSPASPVQAIVVVSSCSSFSNSRFSLAQLLHPLRRRRRRRLHLSSSSIPDGEGSELQVQELHVPEDWLVPSRAHAESEWLRRTLNEWLDEEYCPEPTNLEISRIAAQSYHESLLSKETDLCEILLKMVRCLETLSYRQSFHGPFSSANAAVLLITERINSTTEQKH